MLELDPAQLHVVQQWVLKAENDLITATLTLKSGGGGPEDTICFHAQQAEQERLTDFATVTRYPRDYEPITRTEARRAVTLARRIRRQVRRWLPKQAL